nr:ribose-phosphate diphosphokinase [Sneathiella chinensis]
MHFHPASEAPARQLAAHLDVPCHPIHIHTFPDGESRVRIHPVTGTALLFVSLDRPNEKLIQTLFAAGALKENGADRIVLVAPYLCYMRQDTAFEAGDAVSQRLMAGILSGFFDRIVTVDPHLHRIHSLREIFPDCETDALGAAPLIADLLAAEPASGPRILVGPDSESEQWVRAIADRAGLPFTVATKQRFNDRDVAVSLPETPPLHNVHAILIDDILSSGGTLSRCANAVLKAGARKVEVIVVHDLGDSAVRDKLQKDGIARLRSTDSVPAPSNALPLAPLLADALINEKTGPR